MAMNETPLDPPRATDALAPSEARFAGILAIAADAIISIDEQQRIILFNEGAEQAFGYKRDEVVGQRIDMLLPERFRSRHVGLIRAFGASGATARKMGERQEVFALHKDGTEFPAEASISRLEIEGQSTYTVVLRDISERKATEVALRESEQRLWAFLNNSSVVAWMKDSDGRYVFLSANFLRRFNRQAGRWIGKTDLDIWPRPVAEAMRQGDLSMLSLDREHEALECLPNSDGDETWWIIHRFPFKDSRGRTFTGALAVDVTQRKVAEDALARSKALLETRVEERTQELRREMERRQEAQAALTRLQRLESLGQLTGGVAHDFNNLLTVISGNLQLIGMDLEDERLRKYLDEAERAASMGARLNQRLLTFAKQRQLSPRTSNLNEQVTGIRDILCRTLGETITLVTGLDAGLWPVRVDPGEIDNALINLAVNARDAMPAGGTLTITTRNVVIGEADARPDEGLDPGRYVLLSVSDTGTGMSPEVLARAFEPFFTTKGHGRGTGLGLATIYGLVRQSGGHIGIDSAPGQGTRVDIRLPVVEAETARDDGPRADRTVLPARGQTILVVEDDSDVRRVTVERLAALGYRPIEAEAGQAALELLEKGTPVDLVFSDVVMPGGISGVDLVRILRGRWPGLPVLLTSGYAPESLGGGAQERPPILMKPYDLAALAEAVSLALQDCASQGRSTSAVKT